MTLVPELILSCWECSNLAVVVENGTTLAPFHLSTELLPSLLMKKVTTHLKMTTHQSADPRNGLLWK